MSDKQVIFDNLVGCLKQVIGADVVELLGVTEQSKIFSDLGLTSIDMVAWMEKIGEIYPVEEQFAALVTQTWRQLSRLTLGDIADWICDVTG